MQNRYIELLLKASSPWIEKFGKIFRVAFYLIVIFILFLNRPDDISNTPFARLTLSDLSGPFIVYGGIIGCVYCLFNPDQESPEHTRIAWGYLGIVMIIGAVFIYYKFIAV